MPCPPPNSRRSGSYNPNTAASGSTHPSQAVLGPSRRPGYRPTSSYDFPPSASGTVADALFSACKEIPQSMDNSHSGTDKSDYPAFRKDYDLKRGCNQLGLQAAEKVKGLGWGYNDHSQVASIDVTPTFNASEGTISAQCTIVYKPKASDRSNAPPVTRRPTVFFVSQEMTPKQTTEENQLALSDDEANAGASSPSEDGEDEVEDVANEGSPSPSGDRDEETDEGAVSTSEEEPTSEEEESGPEGYALSDSD